jgi:hypothetical protein
MRGSKMNTKFTDKLNITYEVIQNNNEFIFKISADGHTSCFRKFNKFEEAFLNFEVSVNAAKKADKKIGKLNKFGIAHLI